MSLLENSLVDLYVESIINKRSVLNEEPVGLGASDYDSTRTKEGLMKQSRLQATAKSGQVNRRFYLFCISKIEQISDDIAVAIAVKTLGNVILRLKKYPDAVYPGATTDFREEVIVPAVSEALATGGVATNKTNLGYIARTIMQAAVATGVLVETGEKRKTSGRTANKMSSDDIAGMFGVD